ncbi:GAF domain-containing protein [Streptomyces reniochalinae]|uniref:protein-serine/threonine phosphatase n=1 Tax=Streptomyces reniochalinae TaxID=2250578 RepID=A0A367EKT6_9ACTN|nr:GAF domain-containing protein [Streptomyces reniochalinae]
MGASDGNSELKRELAQARARLRLLSDVGLALTSVLDPDKALGRLTRLVVQHLADACMVDLVEDGMVRRAAVAHQEPAHEPQLQPHVRLPGPGNSATPLARVLRGSGPQTVTVPTEPSPPAEPDPLHTAQLRLYRRLGAGTVLIVPLQVHRGVLGALSLVRSASDKPFDEEVTGLAGDLAHRAALTLENARLYALQQDTAEQLQRSLLPELSGFAQLQLAARYVPAREGAEVGGDWYDAFRLRDGSTVLAIGDVVGHDLTAAVRMGQLRNMLRALAYDSEDAPSGVMRRLDAVMQGLSETELVTAVIARVHKPAHGPWTAHWTNAGHPPPLLTSPAEGSRLLEEGLSPVLGVDSAIDRDDAQARLPPDATLLFYTDGLIERPGEDISRGLTRLRQHAASVAGLPLDEFCDALLERLADGHQDDIALLAFRTSADT